MSMVDRRASGVSVDGSNGSKAQFVTGLIGVLSAGKLLHACRSIAGCRTKKKTPSLRGRAGTAPARQIVGKATD